MSSGEGKEARSKSVADFDGLCCAVLVGMGWLYNSIYFMGTLSLSRKDTGVGTCIFHRSSCRT